MNIELCCYSTEETKAYAYNALTKVAKRSDSNLKSVLAELDL